MADKSLFDTSDLDRWIGVPIGGGEIIEDIHVNDIRRWVQAMQNPNPLHYDKDWAAGSRFGRILAPQSFTVNCTWGHGAEPSIQGVVPGTHMLFGGDEWQRVHGDPPWRTARLAQDIAARHDRNGREQWQDCAKDGWRS